jgi:hypothetical protein
MSRIGWGRSALSGLAVGLVLLGCAALAIAGCSRSAASTMSDDASASAVGSSMKVEGVAPVGGDTAAVANLPGSPSVPNAPTAVAGGTEAATVPAVPAPVVPPVSSPTTTTLAAAAPVSPSPVAPANLAKTSPPATAVLASTGGPVLKGLGGNGMQGTVQKLNPVMIRALKKFEIASAAFPDFCRDWGRKLSARERDNLRNIKWEMHDGVETGKYVGYGAIDSCTCKEATNGVAVGILTYKEFDYTLTGKSVEEAQHSTPHATAIVPTREIFAYDRGKWFW